MSPELFDPEKFGLKDNRRTRESDCYALAMVILEVLTGQVPFPRYDGFIVMRKVVDGERPERPQGPEVAWFTDDLWEMLERCWSPDPKLRPAVEAVLECLEWSSTAWHPLPPSADDDSQLDDDHDSFSTMSHLSRAPLDLYLNPHLPTKLPANQTISPVEFDLVAGVSGGSAASGGGTSTGNDCDLEVDIDDDCDSEVDIDDELLRLVDGDVRSRPGQETDTAISSHIHSGLNATLRPRVPSISSHSHFLLPADKLGSPSQKPPSPPSSIIPVNAENSGVRVPLISALQGDSGVMNGPQLHPVPATPDSWGAPTIPFIDNPTEGTFCSLRAPSP